MSRVKFILVALFAGLVSAPSWSGAEVSAPIIKGIRVFGSGENTGVEISADKDLVYTCTKIPPLLKVIIDLPGTEPGRPDTDYKVDSTMITTIRLEKKSINDVLITRITFNLTEDADYTARLDPTDRKKLTVYLSRSVLPSPTVSITTVPDKSVAHLPPPLTRQTATIPPVPLPVVPPASQSYTNPVTVSGVSFGLDTIEIQTEGAVREFRSFTLREPGRLVIDIPDARSAVRAIAVPVNRFGVVAARIGPFEKRLRLVFDVGMKLFPGYNVEKTVTGLRVAVRKGE